LDTLGHALRTRWPSPFLQPRGRQGKASGAGRSQESGQARTTSRSI